MRVEAARNGQSYQEFTFEVRASYDSDTESNRPVVFGEQIRRGSSPLGTGRQCMRRAAPPIIFVET